MNAHAIKTKEQQIVLSSVFKTIILSPLCEAGLNTQNTDIGLPIKAMLFEALNSNSKHL